MTALTRVTHMTVRASTLNNLQVNLQKMADLQAQMSSGKKINKPSDNPAGTSDMLRIRGDQRTMAQYSRNADNGAGWLTTIDSALQTSLATLRTARDRTVQGGSGALGTSSRTALAEEIDGLRDTLVEQSNATYLGRSVFAGTSDKATYTVDATTDPPTYTFTGTPGSSVDRQVANGTSVRVDSNGAKVFGVDDGTDQSVFALLDQISDCLRNTDDDPTVYLDKLDGHMNAMLTEVSSVGARENQIDSAQSRLTDQQLTATTQLSSIEDIDLAQIILDLQTQEVAYQGALGAAAKVLQPTLLDFLQ